MLKSWLTLLILSAAFNAFAQEKELRKLPAFGKPDMEELLMKECAFDKHANAVKLLDYQEKEVVVDYDLSVKTERRVRIKIFNEKGFNAASIIIPYISRIKGTKIKDISAYIYTLEPDGKITSTKVEKKQIFRDKSEDAVKKIRFTFPNLKPGCVVEYKYEKKEKNSLNLEPWFFQDIIPTLTSRYKLILPGTIPMEKRAVAIDSLEEYRNTEKSSNPFSTIRSYTYVQNNVPAFKPEPMMNSLADNLKRIEFAVLPRGFNFASVLMGNKRWKFIAIILNQVPFFGKQFDKQVPGTESLLDTAGRLLTREEKINYIYQEVKKRVKWDDQQTFYADDIAEAWKSRSGNSAEINLLLLNLLRKSGIKCSPLLISTRDNGEADESFFTLGQFNGVDVLIADSSNNYILDGTQKYQSYKTPPLNILNRNAFNADTASADWFFISDPRPLFKSTITVLANLSEKGQLSGETSILFYDHSKVQRMMDKNKTEEEEKEEEKEFLKKDFTELKIDSLYEQNADDDLQPLKQKFNFNLQPNISDKFLFLDPFFLSSFRKNPFTDSIRFSNIDFGSNQYLKTSLYINIPENYTVDHLPTSTLLRMSDSSIMFKRIIQSNASQILFSNTMEVLTPVFPKGSYPAIREFFEKIYTMVGEQIILKRKD